MGLVDALNAEDRVQVRFTDFYNLMEASAGTQARMKLLENCIKCGVPHTYIRSMLTGEPEKTEVKLYDDHIAELEIHLKGASDEIDRLMDENDELRMVNDTLRRQINDLSSVACETTATQSEQEEAAE